MRCCLSRRCTIPSTGSHPSRNCDHFDEAERPGRQRGFLRGRPTNRILVCSTSCFESRTFSTASTKVAIALCSRRLSPRKVSAIGRRRSNFDRTQKKASSVERDLANSGKVVKSSEVEIPACVHDLVGGLFVAAYDAPRTRPIRQRPS